MLMHFGGPNDFIHIIPTKSKIRKFQMFFNSSKVGTSILRKFQLSTIIFNRIIKKNKIQNNTTVNGDNIHGLLTFFRVFSTSKENI